MKRDERKSVPAELFRSGSVGPDAGSAVQRWRADLESWAIPEALLEATEDSPYGWPQHLWKRRSAGSGDSGETYTTQLLRRLLPQGGSLLDIGAGRGHASLPLAAEGYRLVAVERDAGMTEGLREDAAARDVEVSLIEGEWPDIADAVDPVDVVMCAHVVYDVQAIGPFLAAMHQHARVAAVVELTPTHPWSNLAPYYRALHGLERPQGPTAEDLAEVVEEVVGARPRLTWWEREGGLWFRDWSEIEAFLGRRLVLPRDRWGELQEVVGSDVVEKGGRLYIGHEPRRFVTLWWAS